MFSTEEFNLAKGLHAMEFSIVILQSLSQGNPRHFCGVTSTGGSARIAWAESSSCLERSIELGNPGTLFEKLDSVQYARLLHDARLPRLQKHVELYFT